MLKTEIDPALLVEKFATNRKLSVRTYDRSGRLNIAVGKWRSGNRSESASPSD